MDFDKILRLILREKKDLEKEKIMKMINRKIMDAEGYLTTESAALVLAYELGVNVPKKPTRFEILIQDLVSDLKDVTITGEIINHISSRSFMKKDGTPGYMKEFIIGDKTGRIRVLLWNEKTRLLQDEEMKPGQKIRILHGYTREGFDGKTEIHIGTRGNIQIIPQISENPEIKEE